jgi:hypothetical protein
MAENIVVDVSSILSVIAGLRDRNPQAAENTLYVLKLLLNREGFLPGDVTQALAPLTAAIKALSDHQQDVNLKLEKIMGLQEDMNAKMALIDDATTKASQAVTAIGTRITGLEAAIKAAGLTPEQQAGILAHLDGITGNVQALASALEPMGQAPADPVPVEPPAALPQIQ